MKSKIIIQPNDLILSREDDTHFIHLQGENLSKYLKHSSIEEYSWDYFVPVGGFPPGSYAEIVSPIFSGKEQFDIETVNTKLAINKFIEDLNKSGQSVARIECWLEQSDDIDALPHPMNGATGQGCYPKKYHDNQDFKNGNWAFEYIMSSAKMTNKYGTSSAYGNRFDVTTNDKCEITKKYFILKLKSSWRSI